MPIIDDYIFGNGALHERFRFVTQVLAALVACAPRSLSIAQLQKYTHRSARELDKLCETLRETLLVQPDEAVRGNWLLACEPSAVTLEDVFRLVIAPKGDRLARTPATPDPVEQLLLDVDLLVMQATMAINQSVFMQLRQFSLDRLRASSAAKPPVSKQAIRNALYDNEYDFEVNAWLIDSVFSEQKRQRKSR